MKLFNRTAIWLSLSLLASGSMGYAQQFFFTFNENGVGTLNGNPIPAMVGLDPSGGIAANVLTYNLPVQVTPGDVGLLEPNASTGTPSDLVRFFNPAGGAGGTTVIFYSDMEAGEPNDLADVGVPQSPNAILINETGPEGNNGALWTPLPGQPGFLPGSSVSFQIVSDVPEPAPMLVLALGLGMLALVKRHY